MSVALEYYATTWNDIEDLANETLKKIIYVSTKKFWVGMRVSFSWSGPKK